MDEPVFNDYELEIENAEIYSFLEKHITKSMEDENTRKGIFRKGINIVKDVSMKIIKNSDYFIEGSKEIAKQLFKAMKTNNSIASTDLIICWFQTNDENYIGILKMDYNTTFIHNVEVLDNRFKISIKKQEISLPNIGQKIQKCVFVKEDKGNEEYNLIILDNQINSKDEVAQFFINTFLDAELITDNRTLTKIFKKETQEWIQKKEKEGEDLSNKTIKIVNNIMHEEDEIDIASVSNKLFEDKSYLKEEYIKNLEDKGLHESTFIVDKEWVEKKLTKVKIKTDTNIELTLDYNLLSEKNIFEIIAKPDGTKEIIIKNIKSITQK
jgi:hypothetical protein